MNKVLAAVFIPVIGLWTSGCGDCAPAGPSGTSVQFSGSIAGGSLVFHDVAVPANTDSVDVDVQWTPASAQLLVIQIHATCDPTLNACEKLTDPQRPSPMGPPTTISGYLATQRGQAAATGSVRFLIQNTTADVTASYTAIATPKRHGCER